MSRIDRISPTFGARKIVPSYEINRTRRPNLSSVSNLVSDSESNPASTKNLQKHQRQASTIFANPSLSKKLTALKKPQLSTKIFEMAKLVSNRSNDTSSSRQQAAGKENVQPKPRLTAPRQDPMPQLKRISSRSHHEQEFHELNSKNQYATQPDPQPPQMHSRTISQDQQPKKTKAVNIDFDMLCPDKQKTLLLAEDQCCGFDEESLYHLYKREAVYQISPNYQQPQITHVMRAVLIDWLVEVCKEFTLKRETLHLAIHNFDRYMSRKDCVPKSELQLVGVANLYIACKIEEIYPPKVSDFSQASNYGFTNKQILACEQDICTTLKWFLNPPSLYLWATWYMSQWDLFCKDRQIRVPKNDRVLMFKMPNQQSYAMYRQFMNLLDCAILDLRTFQHSNRELVATLIYLLTLKQYLGTNLPKLHEQLKAKEAVMFQRHYAEFLQLCFGFGFASIANCIKYMMAYMPLDMVIDQPGTSKIPQEKEMEEHYEYFLSIQTHSPNHLVFVRQRLSIK